jgi:hypothetical protein
MGRPKGSKNKVTKTATPTPRVKNMVQAVNKGGRPRTTQEYDTNDRLCAIQCTGEEIASVLGIDYDTLNSNIKHDKKLSFSEYFIKKSGGGKASLRRRQFELAANGNTTMLVWLGKQYLGQTDKTDIQIDEDRVDKLDVLLGQFHDTNSKA